MSLARMQGGVEVPRGEQSWTNRLTGSFEHLNTEIQGNIIDIIKALRDLDPEKAKDAAHKISDFFAHTGDYAKDGTMSIQEFLARLQDELEKERKKNIQ